MKIINPSFQIMDEIKKSACKNRRTVNKEIEMMLDYYINKVANKNFL